MDFFFSPSRSFTSFRISLCRKHTEFFFVVLRCVLDNSKQHLTDYKCYKVQQINVRLFFLNKKKVSSYLCHSTVGHFDGLSDSGCTLDSVAFFSYGVFHRNSILPSTFSLFLFIRQTLFTSNFCHTLPTQQ